jgi:hypothetical protein
MDIKAPRTIMALRFRPFTFACWTIIALILGQMTYSPNAKDAINTLLHSTLHTSLIRFPYGPMSRANPTPALTKSGPYSLANTRIARSPVQ